MRRLAVAALVAVVLCTLAPWASGSEVDEIRDLRTQIELLSERLRVLEARAGLVSPSPAATAAPTATTAAIDAAADPALDWARRLSLKGDLRVRHEQLERDGLPDRDRQRLRARVALTAQALETVDVTVGLASGGDDPRSANQTFGSNFSRKDVGLDLAYVDWHPTDTLNVYGGKMKYAGFKPAFTAFIDGDLNPEGLAVGWRGAGGVFANAFGYWIEERAANVDSMWFAGQVGWRGSLADGINVAAGVTYHDFTNVQGQEPFYLGQSFGNTTTEDGSLRYDYDLAQLAVELGFLLGEAPMSIIGEYGRNLAVDELDTAWSLGVLLGKASAPGTWEVGYAYGDLEKDALFAQVTESDFADGRTDSRGHFVHAGYAIARHWIASLQLYLNDLDVSADSFGFDRLQLDLNFKY